MDYRYNFNNLEASFKNYLLAGNKKATVKNYLSDFRHFLGWLVFKFKSSSFSQIPEDKQSSQDLVLLITPSLVEEYKAYLSDNRIPLKTINRRLSTVRKFCSFCISQGWMKENAGKQVQNSKPKIDLLSQFKADLIKDKVCQSTIINYLNDVQEYLNL